MYIKCNVSYKLLKVNYHTIKLFQIGGWKKYFLITIFRQIYLSKYWSKNQKKHIGPKLLPMEMPIPNFCSWNCHGDSMSRSSEFRIPIEFRIPNFCPWNRHGNSKGRSSELGILLEFWIPNFCSWNPHGDSIEQKFGIGISMDRSLGP